MNQAIYGIGGWMDPFEVALGRFSGKGLFMAQHSELQAAPRLAGYESWLYQMPCLSHAMSSSPWQFLSKRITLTFAR